MWSCVEASKWVLLKDELSRALVAVSSFLFLENAFSCISFVRSNILPTWISTTKYNWLADREHRIWLEFLKNSSKEKRKRLNRTEKIGHCRIFKVTISKSKSCHFFYSFHQRKTVNAYSFILSLLDITVTGLVGKCDAQIDWRLSLKTNLIWSRKVSSHEFIDNEQEENVKRRTMKIRKIFHSKLHNHIAYKVFDDKLATQRTILSTRVISRTIDKEFV